MLNIKQMIVSNDFSQLLNSTYEQRELCGGNMSIYNELRDYIFIYYISEIIRDVFKHDIEVLWTLENDLKNKPEEPIISLVENEEKIEPIFCLLNDGFIEYKNE